MKTNILLLLLVCLASSSCIKMKLEETYSKQETKIDDYLTKNITMQKDSTVIETDPDTGEKIEKKVQYTDTLRIEYNGGSARLIREEGTGEPLNEKGAVSFYYAGYIFTGSPSTLFATNSQEIAQKEKLNLTDADYEVFEVDMRDTELLNGVRNGLIGIRTGEECEILFSGKYAFGNQIFGTIPANSALLFKIWEVVVSNE